MHASATCILALPRWVASILDGVQSDTVKGYVGRIKTFSKNDLGFAERFVERKVGSIVDDFNGCPFNSPAVDEVMLIVTFS